MAEGERGREGEGGEGGRGEGEIGKTETGGGAWWARGA